MSRTISARFPINYSRAHYSALCSGIPAYAQRRFPNTATEMANQQEMGRNTEWPKNIYTLFTHQYLWNKFK